MMTCAVQRAHSRERCQQMLCQADEQARWLFAVARDRPAIRGYFSLTAIMICVIPACLARSWTLIASPIVTPGSGVMTSGG